MAASSSATPAATSTGSAITVAASPSVGGAGAAGGTGVTGSPCAGCKFLRRRCQRDCVFAPYFPPENPQKFVHVHRVFGASNVTKILNDLPSHHREDTVNSLAYEAEMRIQDPVYGCVGVISILQHRLRQLQQELARATHELSKYQAAAAAAAEAAAASVAVGSNGAAAGMADFVVGNPPSVLNFTQTNFINVGPSTAASIGGGAGFVQNDYLASVQMLARSHEAAAAARVGPNNGGGAGGGYAFGYCSSAMGAAGHGVVPDQLGQIGGGGKFLGSPVRQAGTSSPTPRSSGAPNHHLAMISNPKIQS